MRQPVRFIQKKFNYFLIHKNMFTKLVISFMVVVCMPTMLLSYILLQNQHSSIFKEIQDTDEKIADQYTNEIEYKIDIFQNYSSMLSNDHVLQSMFLEPENMTKSEVLAQMRAFNLELNTMTTPKVQEYIYKVKFYSYREDFPCTGTYIGRLDDEKDNSWYELLKDGKSTDFFYITSGMHYPIISLIQPMYEISESYDISYLGSVKVDIYANRFFNLTGFSSDSSDMEFAIWNRNNELMYTHGNEHSDLEQIRDSMLADQQNYRMITENGEKELCFLRSIEEQGWVSLYIFDYSTAKESISESLQYTALLTVILLGAFVLIALWLSKILSKRFEIVTKKIQKVRSGDLQPGQPLEGSDEAAIIDQQFTEMMVQIRSLFSQVRKEEQQKRDSEIRALQLQINPHFLYNTLETISSMAAVYGHKDIASMCQHLGSVFRYSIGTENRGFVPFREELVYIQNYLSIQNVRFQGRTEVFYDIPEECEDYLIVKFILQPVLENAFSHGMKADSNNPQLLIEISANADHNRLTICVKDNGKGIDPEKVRQMNEMFAASPDTWSEDLPHKGIGLINVNRRIKLLCPGDYGVTVSSTEGKGTQVTLTMPLMKSDPKERSFESEKKEK